MRNDAGWTGRTDGKTEAPPKKLETIIDPFLKKELGIDLGVGDQPSNVDMNIAQAAYAEAARLLFLASPHSSPNAEFLLGNADFIVAVSDKLGDDNASLEKAVKIQERLRSEIKSGLGIARHIV